MARPSMTKPKLVQPSSYFLGLEGFARLNPKWILVRASDNQRALTAREPRFIFDKISDSLSSVDAQFWKLMTLQSTLTVSLCQKPNLRDIFLLEEAHQLKEASGSLLLAPVARSLSSATVFPLVSNVIKSWELQFSFVEHFLEILSGFLKKNDQAASIEYSEALELNMEIRSVRLVVCLMPMVIWRRPFVNVQYQDSKFQLTNQNFSKMMPQLLNCMRIASNFSISSSLYDPIGKRKNRLQKDLLEVYLKTHLQWKLTSSDSGWGWKLTPVEPFHPLLGLESMMDPQLCRTPLESSLLITVLSDTHKCTLDETHSFRTDNFHWIHKATDDMLFTKLPDLLSSWENQFALIDLLFQQLVFFLKDKGVLQLKFKPTHSLLHPLSLEAGEVRMGFQLIPPMQLRPGVRVVVNNLKILTLNSASAVTAFVHSLIDFVPRMLRLGKKRKSTMPLRPIVTHVAKKRKTQEDSTRKPSEPLMSLLEKLKSILMTDDQMVMDFPIERTKLMQKLGEWVQAGLDVTFRTDSDKDILIAVSGDKGLTVEFVPYYGISKPCVGWKLKLGLRDASVSCLMISGMSSNFYGPLVACLECFLKQKPEEHIIVEVKMEPEAGEQLGSSGSRLMDEAELFIDLKKEEPFE